MFGTWPKSFHVPITHDEILLAWFACHCEVVIEFLNLLGLHMQLLLYLLNHLHLTPQGFSLLPPSRQGCEQPVWVLAAYQGSTMTAGVQTAASRGF